MFAIVKIYIATLNDDKRAFLSMRSACEYVGISRQTLYNYIKESKTHTHSLRGATIEVIELEPRKPRGRTKMF